MMRGLQIFCAVTSFLLGLLHLLLGLLVAMPDPLHSHRPPSHSPPDQTIPILIATLGVLLLVGSLVVVISRRLSGLALLVITCVMLIDLLASVRPASHLNETLVVSIVVSLIQGALCAFAALWGAVRTEPAPAVDET